MFWTPVSVLLLCIGDVAVAVDNTCFGPRGYGFKSCPPNMGLSANSLRQLSVRGEVECVRACIAEPQCKSVNAQLNSSLSSLQDCQLMIHLCDCDNLQPMSDYRFYTKIHEYYPCLTIASEVKGATFLKNNTFSLIFENTIQTFRLQGEKLRAVQCPMKVTDYFFEYYGPPKAALRTDALVITGPLYYIYDDKVMQYMTPPIDVAYPSYFSPWPVSISHFFGAGVPDDLTAAYADGTTFYAITADSIYTTQYHWPNGSVNTGVSAGFDSSEFLWSDVTAAAFNTETRVLVLFTGNKYFLYDTNTKVVIGKGTVCTNL